METTILGLSIWTFLAIIVGIILLIVILIHARNQRKRRKDFEEELQEKLDAIGPGQSDGQTISQ